jgi:putative transposase
MSKLHRFPIENACYHVVTRTQGRIPFLRDPSNAAVVVDALQFVRGKSAYLLGYAVLPDHLHALLVPIGDVTISSLMHGIKGYSSRALNARQGRRGPLWQRSFYDRAIRSESQLTSALEYIHNNPVIAGFAEAPEQYSFSSAHPKGKTDLELFLGG